MFETVTPTIPTEMFRISDNTITGFMLHVRISGLHPVSTDPSTHPVHCDHSHNVHLQRSPNEWYVPQHLPGMDLEI